MQLSRGVVFRALLKATVEAWSREQPAVGVPAPAEAVELFTSLGIMHDNFWAETIWSMLASTINQSENRALQTMTEGRRVTSDQSTLTRGLADILEIWKIFFATFVPKGGKGGYPKQPSRDWSCLPDAETLKSVRGGFTKNLQSRFLHVVPNFPSSSTSRSLTLAMVSTFSVLYPSLREVDTGGPFPSDELHFAHFVAHLLPYAEIGLPKAKAHLESLEMFPPQTIGSLTSNWDRITEQAMAILTIGRKAGLVPGDGDIAFTDGGSDLDRNTEALFLKRISRALERMDLLRAENLWLEVHRWYRRESTGSNAEVSTGTEKARSHPGESASGDRIPSKLYHRFLMVFMALRRPQKAIDVWNDMISSGQQPTPASWCAMIDGCGTARDVNSLESIWQKMLASGVKADVGCWTSRIHGLISCGKLEQGIMALEEMGSRWKDAVRKSQKSRIAKGPIKFDFSSTNDVNGNARPNTVTVNAVISALLRQRKEDTARKVLRWATSFPIKFDIYTFNTLLRTAFQQGRTDEVQQLLRQMEAAAIKPDVVTFTMIINGIFRNSDPSMLTSPATDLPSTVNNILDEMQGSGVAPNVYTYGTIIDGLLKQDSNLPAARAIFDHMATRNIKSSPQINTMLLTHYFAQLPPDLPEIESLWKRIRLEGGFVDFIFYDRMIEGYAKIGQIGKMMSFLLRMLPEGMTPSWEALCFVLQALVESEEWERLKEIIRDARDQNGLFKDGVRGLKGEENFWTLVDEYESKGLASYN